jgi:hypothetical protein
VRVVADCDTEKLYAEQVDEAVAAANSHAERLEKAQNAVVSEDPTEATLRLVTDAIKSQESSTALRRANKLANRKQGRRAGFGWTVEEMLRNSVEEETYGAKAGDHRKKKQGGSSQAVSAEMKNLYIRGADWPCSCSLSVQALTRQEMKQLSQSRVHFRDGGEKGEGGSGAAEDAGPMQSTGGKE